MAYSSKIVDGSDAVLNLAGIYNAADKGLISAGVSKQGRAVFSSAQLASSTDVTAGALMLHTLTAFVDPFHVLTQKEKDGLKYLSALSASKDLMMHLNKEHLRHEGESFAVTLLKAVKADVDHHLGVIAALKLYDHWGVMSPAQKSLGIAALGVQTHKTPEGGNICDLKIIDGPGQVVTVKNVIDLLKEGKNPYALVQHWNQIEKLHRVFNGKPDVEAMSDFASSHNLLAKTFKDAAVPGVTKKKIAANGFKPSPQYGVGSLSTPSKTKTPGGYTKTASTPQGDLITPSANAKTASGALQGSLLGTKAGINGISADAAGVYNKWDKKDAKTVDKGAEGGSAFIAGLSGLKRSNPYLFSALVAFIAHYTHEAISQDNPIKYAASLAGIALARLVTGKKEKQAEMDGVQITSKIQGSDVAEWAKAQINLKALYANFGISSKADAYQLSNQAYSQGRINESDLVAMHEIFDIVYNTDGLDSAQKLMRGKDRGLQIAREEEPKVKNTMTAHETKSNVEAVAAQAVHTKEDIRARNAAKYKQIAAYNAQQQQAGQPPQQAQPQGAPQTSPQPQAGTQPPGALQPGGMNAV